MKNINRLKNKAIARLASYFPILAKRLIASYTPLESADIPWMPVKKQLSKSKIAEESEIGWDNRRPNRRGVVPLGKEAYWGG